MLYTVRMEQQGIDIEKYPGEWLALEPGTWRVVAHSFILREAKEKAVAKGVEHPSMFSCPTADHPYVGHGVILSRKD